MSRIDDIDKEGRRVAYKAALEAGGAGGVLDVLDAAIIRAVIQWVARTAEQRKAFWEDVLEQVTEGPP
jgi:hypothetical protein